MLFLFCLIPLPLPQPPLRSVCLFSMSPSLFYLLVKCYLLKSHFIHEKTFISMCWQWKYNFFCWSPLYSTTHQGGSIRPLSFIFFSLLLGSSIQKPKHAVYTWQIPLSILSLCTILVTCQHQNRSSRILYFIKHKTSSETWQGSPHTLFIIPTVKGEIMNKSLTTLQNFTMSKLSDQSAWD